jgi:hypothetical protein
LVLSLTVTADYLALQPFQGKILRVHQWNEETPPSCVRCNCAQLGSQCSYRYNHPTIDPRAVLSVTTGNMPHYHASAFVNRLEYPFCSMAPPEYDLTVSNQYPPVSPYSTLAIVPMPGQPYTPTPASNTSCSYGNDLAHRPSQTNPHVESFRASEAYTKTEARGVFFGSLPFSMTKQALWDLIQPVAMPTEIKLPDPVKKGRQNRGHAIVRFSSMAQALKVTKHFSGTELFGRKIEVHLDKERDTVDEGPLVVSSSHEGGQ